MHSVRDTPKSGFPHSEILRSQLGYQLPQAYRRFQRPSSPLDAKSSAVCPSWSDHPCQTPTANPTQRAGPTDGADKNAQHATAPRSRLVGEAPAGNSGARFGTRDSIPCVQRNAGPPSEPDPSPRQTHAGPGREVNLREPGLSTSLTQTRYSSLSWTTRPRGNSRCPSGVTILVIDRPMTGG